MSGLKFTAEASLYKSTRGYYVRGISYMTISTIAPSLAPWFRSQRFWHCLSGEAEYCNLTNGPLYDELGRFNSQLYSCYERAKGRCNTMDRALPP